MQTHKTLLTRAHKITTFSASTAQDGAGNKETQMANATSDKAAPAAPLFGFAKTVLEEMDKQGERMLEYGMQQLREATELGKTIRGQSVALGKTMIQAAEQLAADAHRSGTDWSKSFGFWSVR
jgi:hypothetical protein